MTAVSIAHTISWVDYAIVGIILLSTIVSFFRGFLREMISLAVWVVGILLALKFAGPLQGHLQDYIHSAAIRYVLTFLGIFFLMFSIGIIINLFTHSLISKAGLTVTDRFLGIFFGVARGILIVAVLLMFVSVGKVKEGVSFPDSKLVSRFQPMVSWLDDFLPDQLKEISTWVFEKKHNIDAVKIKGTVKD